MLRLAIPSVGVSRVLGLCLQGLADTDLKARVGAAQATIVAAEQIYADGAAVDRIHEYPTHDMVDAVTKEEMGRLYKNQMLRKTGKARAIYDDLLIAAADRLCPYCAQRLVSTLDHYLPKAGFPMFAVTPVNLVPSCKDCNFEKLDDHAAGANVRSLHPYFDDVGGKAWLAAKVLQGSPVAIEFFVRRPNGWSDVLCDRIDAHFAKYKLAWLYGSHAAGELSDIGLRLAQLFDSGGEQAVRSYLEEEAASREARRLNSWQGALYRGLAGDPWFCSDGYREIP